MNAPIGGHLGIRRFGDRRNQIDHAHPATVGVRWGWPITTGNIVFSDRFIDFWMSLRAKFATICLDLAFLKVTLSCLAFIGFICLCSVWTGEASMKAVGCILQHRVRRVSAVSTLHPCALPFAPRLVSPLRVWCLRSTSCVIWRARSASGASVARLACPRCIWRVPGVE